MTMLYKNQKRPISSVITAPTQTKPTPTPTPTPEEMTKNINNTISQLKTANKMENNQTNQTNQTNTALEPIQQPISVPTITDDDIENAISSVRVFNGSTRQHKETPVQRAIYDAITRILTADAKNNMKPMTFEQIARTLNVLNFIRPRGGQWDASSVFLFLRSYQHFDRASFYQQQLEPMDEVSEVNRDGKYNEDTDIEDSDNNNNS